MKTKIIIAIILCGMICLAGCRDSKKEERQNKGEQKAEEYEMQVYRTPTEKELELLEDCNLSGDYMKEIKEKGMSISVQSFVDTAQIMLDYLEKKYDEEFKVLGGEIPGIISGDYSIIAYATEGEYAGEEFEVYYRVDEEGNGYCEDGYFAILKNDEFQEVMQEKANEVEEGWKVFTKLSGVYGKEYQKDTVVEKLNPEELVVEVRCIMSPEKSFEDYKLAQVKLEEKWKKEGYKKSMFYCQFLDMKQWEGIVSYSTTGSVLKQHTDKKPIYRGRIVE